MPVMALLAPVQNVGQLPTGLSAGIQVLRYGLRTTSGTAGGRTGVVDAAALYELFTSSSVHACATRSTSSSRPGQNSAGAPLATPRPRLVALGPAKVAITVAVATRLPLTYSRASCALAS